MKLIIEDSFCYPIFLELFGVNYEFSNLNPKFIDVFKGITPSSLPTLPWAYNRIIYKESQEKKYFNIKDTKTLKTNQSDFEEIIKFKPNEFLVLFSRMNDSLRSSRCSELMEIYLALSLAKDFGFEVNSCCYALKIVARNYWTGVKKDNILYVEFLPKGLTTTNNKTSSVLRRGIPGYRDNFTYE